jgi:hypothetical protein
MGAGLIEIAEAKRIPFIDDYESIGLVPETYTEDKMFSLVEYYGSTYDGELVLYGGQTATERIFGFKRIRDVTTDLDFVCTDDGISRIADGRERLFYHARFDILFSVRDNVPVSFALRHIHDWPVDEGFFSTAETARGFRCPVRCCSREYSIMLKMRRMNECLNNGKAPFGKDALDIINMTTAPYLRSDLPPVDFPLLGRIVKEYVSADPERLERLTSFIAGYREHLTERECSYFRNVMEAFSKIRRTSWKC